MYTPTPQLLAHLKASEGLRLVAYQCPAGKWTIGYGHTPARKGQRITTQQAEQLLTADLRKHYEQLRPHVRVDLTAPQWDALLDMAFNVGVSAVARSTLLRLINARARTADIGAQFLRWNKANGRVLAGLSKRCQWRAGRWAE